MEMPDPKFSAQMLRHLHQLDVLWRNKRGKDRRRCYTDFEVIGECALPCGCRAGKHRHERVRIFEDGGLRHHGCEKAMRVPASITDQVQGMMLTSGAERRRVRKNPKPKPAESMYHTGGWLR